MLAVCLIHTHRERMVKKLSEYSEEINQIGGVCEVKRDSPQLKMLHSKQIYHFHIYYERQRHVCVHNIFVCVTNFSLAWISHFGKSLSAQKRTIHTIYVPSTKTCVPAHSIEHKYTHTYKHTRTWTNVYSTCTLYICTHLSRKASSNDGSHLISFNTIFTSNQMHVIQVYSRSVCVYVNVI